MRKTLALLLLALLLAAQSARAEAMLQYFNTDWRELTARIPELAEAGYNSLWVPPPTKGSGGLSVGYDLFDRFDLGGKEQRGTVRTRYGTEADLRVMIETAHRFGIRVYFDNIMNHNAFDVPGFNATTPIDAYPGFVPEDFHLRVTEDGFYRKWDNTRDWNSAWQVQNLGLADLIDIAHESPNTNHGRNEGDDIPKISFVRQPNNPDYYLDTDLPITVSNTGGSFTVYTFANKEPWQDIGVAGVANSAGNGRFDFVDANSNGQHDAGEASEPFTDTGVDPANPSRQTPAFGFGDGKYNMGNPVVEDVNAMLIRASRWLMDRTHVDGLRLDAVKHVPDYFFGQMSGSDKDKSSAGYLGQSQEQFNLTRGFSDWDNHRDTVFDTEQGRDDAMMFGEHLGQPPGFGGYWDAGMRLVDNDLRNELNSKLGNPSSGLQGFDQPGAGGFAASLGVTHAQSHDNDYAARRELQHAYYFTRAGLPLVYTDGNNHAGVLSQSGGAFPRLANTNFLGQYDDGRLPNLCYIHNHFARGDQRGVWSDEDLVAYLRVDKRENGGMSEADGATMIFLLNDNYSNGRKINDKPEAAGATVGFGAQGGTSNDAYLFNYSTYGGGFYSYASNLKEVVVPPGGYFAFSWRSPEQTNVFAGSSVAPITIQQNGGNVGTVTVERKDGRDGDKAFNPYNLPDANTTDYKYSIAIPRVTDGANLRFIARADGSAENILMALDGGVDINSHIPLGPTTGDKRDRPPTISTDTFLGFEQMQFVRRAAEKFAAKSVSRNVIGSPGAETYRCTIGTEGFTINNGAGTNSNAGTATYVYHDPAVNRDIGGAQFSPGPDNASGQAITVKVKTAYQFQVNQVWLYYTTDSSAPEGSGGLGKGTTQVVAMAYQEHGLPDGSSITDWWTGTIPAQASGTVLRYKVGALNTTAGSVFPSGAPEVDLKKRMETVFQIPNFNATTAKVRTHNDYSEERTGLAEGFHMLRARAFLSRSGKASIYNTWTQTFYYDTQTPGGEIKFPANNGDTVGGQQYGCVVRTDPSVTEVWVHIDDGDATNNDSATGGQAGNGAGPEPFADANGNGVRDTTEAFTDINANGVFDANVPSAWMKVNEVTPSLNIASAFPREWRFNYRNVPASGTATIKVRLLEVSSSRNMSLSAAGAHVTELTRTVNAAGPNLRMFVAYPQQDGQTVGEGYVMKVRFTDSLANGLTEAQLRARLVVEIASGESGSLAGAVVQSAQTLPIIYNAAPGFHDFQFALPNLYNGVPDFLHTVRVTMNRPSPDTDLVTTREVRAEITQPAVFVSINNPPEIDSDGKKYEIVLPAVAVPTPEQRSFTIEVETGSEATAVAIAFQDNAGTATLISDGTPNPQTQGNHLFWRFLWSNITAGSFAFTANVQTDGDPEPEGTQTRNTTVVFRQIVASNEADEDDDEDGLGDLGEATITPLPAGNSETWTNGQVHVHHAYGGSNPLSPDSDGDGLPDGLEVGWRTAANPPTNPATDTDGDGFPNFIGDLDPPFYNTTDNVGKVPGVNTVAEGGDRAAQRAGSVTNPNNPDTDGDGISDGVEDANRNGWVNGDGKLLQPATTNFATDRPGGVASTDWPNNKMDAGETWTETSPTKADSDEDGLNDGFGEDKDFDGLIAGDTNNNRIHDTGELWTETDPLNADTDGDDLPDGWEVRFGLDPLDDGTLNMRTGGPGVAANGASGDPDNDGFINSIELTNGTDPKSPNTGVPPPPNSIVIGPQTPVIVGGVSNAKEFTDWTSDDLIAFDEYDGDGPNNQGSDIYHRNDGFDSSRDIVAFYAHDGGAIASGGDGNFYFRIDLRDLKPFAEDGGLDAYVVIDTGNPASGEYALPDQVDVATEMRWEAVVAAYSGNNGRVYVDTNNASNTVSINQSPASFGVVARDQNAANGFKKAYFNSDLDAVEFSISRQALLDAGWNGLNPAQLNYQVFTTKDGTANSPVGPGDIGGRNDIRDTITDDFLASDYYADQNFLSQSVNSVLRGKLGAGATNDRGKRAKVITLIHGNQAIVPASNVQALINNAAGAGFHRPLDVHEAYGARAAMHITPTLASAIQWAKVDPVSPRQYRDGPAFNTRIKTLSQAGVLGLIGSTFSDHVLDYFSPTFNASNIGLANEFLGTIYGNTHSTQVLWNPERVANHATLTGIGGLGYGYTFIDQMRHLMKWFGRNSALGNDGYRLNEINGVKCFVINDQASNYRFSNTDGGAALSLRDLLHRKARSGTQDQVVILFSNWEDFTDKTKADAYDRNIRWLASRPWTQLVTPAQIAGGQVDLSQPPDGLGDAWGTVARGTQTALAKTAHDFIDHATQESYDNWFNGQSGREESLRDKRFDIRAGVQLPVGKEFGSVALGTGASGASWAEVLTTGASGLSKLARGTAGAAAFETAFHNQTSSDLRKFSTGAYIVPDTSFQNLAGFSKTAQAQFRFAAVFKRVDTWAAAATAGAYNATALTESGDVDLDGENEHLIFNDRVFAVFERLGGRMTGAWARDIHSGEVLQVAGNLLSYAGSESEVEGATNITGGAVNAHRVSGFRDQFAQTGGAGVGTTNYVNDRYSAALAPVGAGWVFTSSDGKIAKTITLAPRATHLRASYALSGDVNTLYVRFGLSPNLQDLLLNGQANLATANDAAHNEFNAYNQGATTSVRAFVRYGSGTSLQAAAVDRDSGVEFDTINMRNLAQTQQVEVFGGNGMAFSLGMQTGATISADSDGDGLPDWWESLHGLDPNSATGINGGSGDFDSDGKTNAQEFIIGTNPATLDFIQPAVAIGAGGGGTFTLTFPTLRDRLYRIYFTDELGQAFAPVTPDIPGFGAIINWTDNGSQTGGLPSGGNRFYKIEIRLPEPE
ncbi:MAG: alpha-amylase family glycosyl hydrolase [Chthoniobacteraceae bacterium]